MKLECIKAPKEILTLKEVKAYLRIDGDEEDELLNSLITAAREHVERYQRRAYGRQQLRLTLSAEEAGRSIELPRSKHLISIDKACSLAGDGAEQQLDFTIRCGDINSCLELAAEPAGDIRIVYTVNGGATSKSVRLAMCMLISGWFENRLAYGADGKALSEMPFGVTALLQGQRVLL